MKFVAPRIDLNPWQPQHIETRMSGLVVRVL
jgi:hypothetical protein